MTSSYTYPDTTLLVFAKAPIPGLCKTRLIPTLGEQGAAELQEKLIENCLTKLCFPKLCDIQLWCAPDTEHPFLQRMQKKYPISLHTQQGEDLGQKMYQAMRQAKTDKSIVIGTDVPLIDQAYIELAIKSLHQGVDAVIGPAEDGGYVLLGLKNVIPELYNGIHWGSHSVLSQTCQKMTGAGLAWRSLKPLWDLDDREGLNRWQSVCQGG